VIAVEVAAFGGPEVLRVVERAAPVPGPGEVVVRVEACGLNWSDLMQRAGTYPGGPKPPFVAGQEAAAIVVAHGAGVTAPPIGTHVAVIGPYALCTELAAVPAEACIPWDVDAEQRAALPIALATAHHALVACAKALPGEVALIHAAAGGVGSIAVQLARLLQLRVIATCGAGKRGFVDADHVCGYDEVRGPVDVVLDGVGGAAFRASCAVLRPFGRIVIIGASSGEPQQIDPVKLVYRSQSVIGMHLRHVRFDPTIASLPVRARVTALPVAEIRAAHEQLAARAIVGKLILRF
jgi:NADPH2:quinone reductase